MLYTLQWSAAITGFVAAALWLRAATVKVAAGEPGTLVITSGDDGASFGLDGIDVRATLYKQGIWNVWAATATAISVALQATAILVGP